MLQNELKFVQLLLQAPKKFRQNDSSYLFQAFWTNVSKLAGESMIKNLSRLKPVKFLGLVSVMVLMMTMFVDEMILRHQSCLYQKSLTSNLKLTKTLWLVTWNFGGGFFSFVPKCPGVLMASPGVLMVSLQCTEHPKCTYGIPPVYSLYPSSVLNIPSLLIINPTCILVSPSVAMITILCTEHPQYTHDIPHCAEHPSLYS